MSDVTEILSSAQGGQLIENLARSLGLSTEQTRTAVEALTPALALGLRNAATNPAVLEHVVAGVVHPTHLAAYDDPAVAHGEEARELGQAAIAQLFGSGSAAGQVAQIAARDVGLRPDILARMLPYSPRSCSEGFLSRSTIRGLARYSNKSPAAAGWARFSVNSAARRPPLPPLPGRRGRAAEGSEDCSARYSARLLGGGLRRRLAERLKQACLAVSIPRHCRRRSSKSRNP